MKRLTTDNPQNNVETMLNYAYAKDGKVYLRYGDGEEEVELFDYLSRVTKSELHCQCCNDIAEDCMECDCIASVLFVVATQAAELRARLKQYEDAPIPDAVPVVRCGECECAELLDSRNMSYHCTHPQWCTSSYGVSGDDFCSYGEKEKR